MGWIELGWVKWRLSYTHNEAIVPSKQLQSIDRNALGGNRNTEAILLKKRYVHVSDFQLDYIWVCKKKPLPKTSAVQTQKCTHGFFEGRTKTFSYVGSQGLIQDFFRGRGVYKKKTFKNASNFFIFILLRSYESDKHIRGHGAQNPNLHPPSWILPWREFISQKMQFKNPWNGPDL